MAEDDDADCVEHVWELTELAARGFGPLDRVFTCFRCGAIRFEPGKQQKRPPL